MRRAVRFQGVVAAGLAVAGATALSRLAGANVVTAGFVYLIAVLALAAWRGFAAGAFASLLATACFNFFFFPPVGTLHVADPENWVALASFLVATTIASRLLARARARAQEAEARRREIEALYELCVELFTASATRGGLDAAAGRALRKIGAQGGGLLLADEGGGGPDWVGGAPDREVHRLLDGDGAGAAAAAASDVPGPGGWRNVRLPVVAGGRAVGTLVAYGTRAGDAALESLARLLALAVERERLLQEQAQVEALRQSDAFKTSLLQAVSHDLSTPLTALNILVESLRRSPPAAGDGAQTVERLAQEAARLQRRVENLLAMARLEAGGLLPRREPTPAGDLFRAAREHLPLVASSARLELAVAPDCPELDVDPALALEILVNLIENAHQASPPGAPIELRAGGHPERPGWVRVEVLDRGRGLAGAASRLGADAAGADDSGRRRLGLEIARSFAAAHGGALTLTARAGGGACARLDLPAALLAEVPAAER